MGGLGRAIAARAATRAIALSGSVDAAATTIEHDLPQLCRAVSIPVFIGGRIAGRHPVAIRAAGAIPLGDDLNLALRGIAATLTRR